MSKNFKLKDLTKIAQELILQINKSKTKNQAQIVALFGDLGAGKTTLTQEISKQLGVKNKLVSPTFVIFKIYQIKHRKFKKLIHLDAYRLNNSQELFNLGWQDLIKEEENLIFIEWPERVFDCLPKRGVLKIFLEHQKEEKTRKIKFK